MREFLVAGVALTFCVVVMLAIGSVFEINTNEDGLLENAQLLVLLVGGVAWTMVGASADLRAASRDWWVAAPLLAAILFIGVGREVTWGEIWNADASIVLALKWVAGGVLFLAIALTGWRWMQKGLSMKAIGACAAARWIYFGIIVFAASDLFEKKVFDIASNQLLEEVLEIFAYFCVMAAALVVRRKV